MQEKNIFFSCY